MRLRITINMDNASFADDNNGTEAARILRELADDIEGATLEADEWSERLRDYNGNTVGRAAVDDAETTSSMGKEV